MAFKPVCPGVERKQVHVELDYNKANRPVKISVLIIQKASLESTVR